MIIGIVGGLIVISGVIAWWLLIRTEGVYLGRRVVIALYDFYAGRYEQIKAFAPEYERSLLAEPLMSELAPRTDPLVLDVATGTGRLPRALCALPTFDGQIIGVDLSRRMLSEATHLLASDGDRVSWIWCPAERLPFADGSFDVVTCLEALEFTDHPAATLTEIIRVLRPGGLLLITNRINEWLPRRIWTEEQIHSLLQDNQIGESLTEAWQLDYHKVWGIKDGESAWIGPRPLHEILICPHCGERLVLRGDGCICPRDSTIHYAIGDDGVIELITRRTH
ncbi:MAG: methyltransferase domain-containing protein [Anaerolineae bacterium]|jgi:ubiquinone/menaquinone biosynthesis C-methylase UbiE|nr:methyltransferase domain-containing protein [Anaerolineae bacterium]